MKVKVPSFNVDLEAPIAEVARHPGTGDVRLTLETMIGPVNIYLSAAELREGKFAAALPPPRK